TAPASPPGSWRGCAARWGRPAGRWRAAAKWRRTASMLAIARAAGQVNAAPVRANNFQLCGTPMNEPRYDVIAIGNAIVDVMAPCADELIEELQLARGGMTLVDTERAHELYDAMGPAREVSGGSAANTLAGL